MGDVSWLVLRSCGLLKFRWLLEVGLGVDKFNLAHETQRKENKLK